MFLPVPTHVIAVRLNVGIAIAVPAAILCINRRLYMLASPISIIPSKAEKNRELIIDLVIGIGLPVIVMVLCLFSPYSYLAHPYDFLAHPYFQRISFKILDI